MVYIVIKFRGWTVSGVEAYRSREYADKVAQIWKESGKTTNAQVHECNIT